MENTHKRSKPNNAAEQMDLFGFKEVLRKQRKISNKWAIEKNTWSNENSKAKAGLS